MTPLKKKPPTTACVGGFRNLFSLAANRTESNPQGLILQFSCRRHRIGPDLALMIARLPGLIVGAALVAVLDGGAP